MDIVGMAKNVLVLQIILAKCELGQPLTQQEHDDLLECSINELTDVAQFLRSALDLHMYIITIQYTKKQMAAPNLLSKPLCGVQ